MKKLFLEGLVFLTMLAGCRSYEFSVQTSSNNMNPTVSIHSQEMFFPWYSRAITKKLSNGAEETCVWNITNDLPYAVVVQNSPVKSLNKVYLLEQIPENDISRKFLEESCELCRKDADSVRNAYKENKKE